MRVQTWSWVQTLVPNQEGSKSPLWILQAQTVIRLNMVQIQDFTSDLRPSDVDCGDDLEISSESVIVPLLFWF